MTYPTGPRAADHARPPEDWPDAPVIFPLAAQAAPILVVSGRTYLWGFGLSVTAATVAQLYDGQDAKGTPGPAFNFAAAGHQHQWFGAPGILMERGIFLVVSSGALTGAIYYQQWGHRRPPYHKG